jgi:hypothetical protein
MSIQKEIKEALEEAQNDGPHYVLSFRVQKNAISWLLHQQELIEQKDVEIARLKPKHVNCHPCLGASEADDYVGMHMSNENCPACRHAALHLKENQPHMTERKCLTVGMIMHAHIRDGKITIEIDTNRAWNEETAIEINNRLHDGIEYALAPYWR